jgi:glutaredoxin 3
VPEKPGEAGKDYNQDSPEVKKVLSQVSIELYGAPRCSECDAARSFMSANRLRFADYNTEANPDFEERARRLSGSAGLPVIVIDGKVLRGFSQSTFQTLLSSAVQSRIEK